MKYAILIGLLTYLILPVVAYAHGFVQDGHDGSLRLIDYVELGAITLGSVGLLIYSFRQYKQNNKK